MLPSLHHPSTTDSPHPSPVAGVGRRGFLKTILLAGAASLTVAPESQAFFKMFEGSQAALDLPEEWIRAQGSIVQSYGEYISKIHLNHVSVEQLLEPHFKKRGRVANIIPPQKLWRNIRATLKVADKISAHLDRPLTNIISAYRSPRYNASCPGAKRRSYHRKNMALDLQFDVSPYRVAKAARELRAAGVFSGGVGRYRSFVHVDTRGYNSDW